MHLGGLLPLRKLESHSYAPFVLINLPRASIPNQQCTVWRLPFVKQVNMVELSKCCLFTEEKLSQILFADERSFTNRNFLQWVGAFALSSSSSITSHSTSPLLSCKIFLSPSLSYWCASNQNALAHYKCTLLLFSLSIRLPFVLLSALVNYIAA